MFPKIRRLFKSADENPLMGELIFRTFMVLITFSVAALIPKLDLLLSLIGAVASTVLALVLPPLMEFILLSNDRKDRKWLIMSKNLLILLIALLGFATGGYESLKAIFETIFSN